MPWGGRRKVAVVAVAHGSAVSGSALVRCGGGYNTLHNDVWMSTDLGATWALQTAQARWAPRIDHNLVAFPDHTIMLLRGYQSGTYLDKVFVSRDYGASWDVVARKPPFEGSEATVTLLLRDGSLLMATGDGGSQVADGTVWRSTDRGATWVNVGVGPWAGRRLFDAVVLPDDSVVVMGGLGSTPLGDVWASFPTATDSPTWSSIPCSDRKRALCQAPASPATISVSLPAAAPFVSPPNAESVQPVTLVYAPPVANISVATATATNSLDFTAQFSAPVTGLAATDFGVSSSPIAPLATVLTGHGDTTFLLRVDVTSGHFTACPPGFTGSSSDAATVRCGRSIEDPAPWVAQAAACEPYSIASTSDLNGFNFLLSLRGSVTAAYWYVCAAMLGELLCSRFRLPAGLGFILSNPSLSSSGWTLPLLMAHFCPGVQTNLRRQPGPVAICSRLVRRCQATAPKCDTHAQVLQMMLPRLGTLLVTYRPLFPSSTRWLSAMVRLFLLAAPPGPTRRISCIDHSTTERRGRL